MKASLVKATKGTFLYLWAEFAMGRVCNGPRLLWVEFVMGRDVPEPTGVACRSRDILVTVYSFHCLSYTLI